MNSDTHQNVIEFVVDRERQIIFSRASGVVSLGDILKYIDAKKQAGVLEYAELLDGRNIVVDLSVSDLPVIGDAMRNSMAVQKTARTALVTNSALIYGLAKRYAEIRKRDNLQFEVFGDYAEASKWVRGEE